MIDKNFVGSCSEIRCYRLVYEEDARTMGRLLRVPYTDLMDLPRFCYRHRVIEDRETVSGVQEIVSA